MSMAKQRLLSTEKRLLKDKEVAVVYQQVLNEYLDKQYICRVPKEEEKPEQEWFLPHFRVVRPERESTKLRIVFDGSAPLPRQKSQHRSTTLTEVAKQCF